MGACKWTYTAGGGRKPRGGGGGLGIGLKGKALSPDEARKATNPHYFDADARASGYRHNCMSCSVTQEALMRGYNVEAVSHAPGTPYFPGSDGAQHYWYDAFSGDNALFHGRDRYAFRGKESSTLLHTERQVQTEIASWGDGARGVVVVRWKGSGSSHILNAVNGGSEGVYFSDGQSGKRYRLGDILGMASPKTGFLVTRVDNLDFTSSVQYLTKGK